jgi:hypothetical protein
MTDARVALRADTDVLDVDDRSHKLGEHFESRPAALLFVRHFG